MDVIELLPRLHFIRLPVGHAYLWQDPDGLTLVDAGLPGSAPALAAAVRHTGHRPADVRRLVLTHFHPDHMGAAADVAAWGDVQVLAHHADAPFIRAAGAGPAPDLADWERPIHERVMRPLAAQAPGPPLVAPRIDRELTDGDEPGFGDGAVTVAVPGHTPGSIACYLPRHGVLFTGDAAARREDGTVICGIFNVNRPQAAESLRRLATLDVTIACFGHGEPLTSNATAALRAATERLPPTELPVAPDHRLRPVHQRPAVYERCRRGRGRCISDPPCTRGVGGLSSLSRRRVITRKPSWDGAVGVWLRWMAEAARKAPSVAALPASVP
jgi:glyoxylase-like metal-dependent hydrolase (beta-lactamase superfamily II)